MPRRTAFPAYSFHKATGQACVHVNRKRIYLGKYDSPESRERYLAVLDGLRSGLKTPSLAPPSRPGTVTLNELFLAFMGHAVAYYIDKRTGRPSAEVDCLKSAIKPARELCGELPVDQFGPMRLRQVREAYIAKGWTRNFCNQSVNRLRSIIKWGIGRELCPPHVLEALRAVEPLRAGKSKARETPRRTAVSGEHLATVREKLKPLYRDMLDLLLLCGCRPGELQSLTAAMIDRSGPVWVATITDHKNAWRGIDRKLFFGPQAQLILSRWLKGKPNKLLFPIGRSTLSNAIKRACAEAGIARFTAYHARHTRATAVRDALGIEYAQATLGHAQPSMTAHYSARLDTLAEAAALKLG